MLTRNVTIVNKLGLHARPAALLTKTANLFDCRITIRKGDKTIDAKSIMGIFSLDLTHPLDLCAYTDGDEKLQEDLKPYLVEKGA